jgi:hypothetical protein
MQQAIITLLSALAISGVAAYYSIFGLAKIFSAAVLPIIIMGAVLEVGKLVTASWLYRNWDTCPVLLKTYFVAAVAVLMFITSMGIFGFLSSAHLEQTMGNRENQSKILRVDEEILRTDYLIDSAEQKILEFESADTNFSEDIQTQIDREQQRIDTAYLRADPQIRSQMKIIERENEIIDDRVMPYRDEITNIDSRMSQLDIAIQENDVRILQRIVGTSVDGSYGNETASKVEYFRDQQLEKREKLLLKIDEIRNDNTQNVDSAMNQIADIRDTVRQEISDSNALVQRLRAQLGTPVNNNKLELVAQQRQTIDTLEDKLDELNLEKFDLETSYRQLEAEVGPIKYLAEIVIGANATEASLENAVKWIILMIVFVFDPLAVLLLIAANMNLVSARNIDVVDAVQIPKDRPDVPNFDDAENVLMKTSGGWQRIDRSEKRRRELNETLKDDKES